MLAADGVKYGHASSKYGGIARAIRPIEHMSSRLSASIIRRPQNRISGLRKRSLADNAILSAETTRCSRYECMIICNAANNNAEAEMSRHPSEFHRRYYDAIFMN